jgi:hypothetical protein
MMDRTTRILWATAFAIGLLGFARAAEAQCQGGNRCGAQELVDACSDAKFTCFNACRRSSAPDVCTRQCRSKAGKVDCSRCAWCMASGVYWQIRHACKQEDIRGDPQKILSCGWDGLATSNSAYKSTRKSLPVRRNAECIKAAIRRDPATELCINEHRSVFPGQGRAPSQAMDDAASANSLGSAQEAPRRVNARGVPGWVRRYERGHVYSHRPIIRTPGAPVPVEPSSRRGSSSRSTEPSAGTMATWDSP